MRTSADLVKVHTITEQSRHILASGPRRIPEGLKEAKQDWGTVQSKWAQKHEMPMTEVGSSKKSLLHNGSLSSISLKQLLRMQSSYCCMVEMVHWRPCALGAVMWDLMVSYLRYGL